MYADFEFYSNSYFGNAITQEDFPRFATRASLFLDYYTMGHARDNPDMPELMFACCDLAEQYQMIELAAQSVKTAVENSEDGGATEKQSETVGSYSVTYRQKADASAAAMSMADRSREQLAAVARQHLSHTGLLYRGGCRPCTRRTR